VPRHARPESLADEIETRFGPYPAGRYIYGFVWPSPDKAEEMADCMIAAMVKRREVTQWLLRDRLPDWRLAITVVSELHSVAEAMWHGIDAGHPLHGQPSASAARRGVEGVYEETDRLIAALQADHPDADLMVFSMHGMGPNKADVASMALLPELLFRRAFGRARLHARRDWRGQAHPPLAVGEDWSAAILAQMGDLDPRSDSTALLAQAARRVNRWRDRRAGRRPPSALAWMPAAHYAPFWPMMDAFALPSFYDGQIRLNLEGREAQGRVQVSSYGALLDELEALLRRARDPVTGTEVVAAVERPLADDPFAQTETRCDLKIAWARHCSALEVPGLGVIGPVPHRRSGGHTGAHGYALIQSPGRDFRRANVVSSFDIVPTLLDLAGIAAPTSLAGQSLAQPRSKIRPKEPA
jgi:predicted AlkP superfamily phosphohydrolase/phosphomutase